MSRSGRPVTVVTGAGRGIGAAVARRLAADGHDLVLGCLGRTADAEQVAEQVRRRGVRAVVVTGDVGDPGTADELFRVGAGLGPVTGLVNNAGLTAHVGELGDTPVDVLRRVVDVNLLGALLCARRAVQVMAEDGGGRGGRGGAMVNVSSAAATLGSAHEYVHYAAAKAVVDAFTRGLAVEVAGKGIRVNAVAPGTVRTGIHSDAGDPGRPDRVAARVPLGRAGGPDDVAPAVAWLLGPESAYVTGAVLRVAGGL